MPSRATLYSGEVRAYSTVAMSELHRVTVDDVGRLYIDDVGAYPSVSTVLDMIPTPTALKRWKRQTEDVDAVLSFKQNRGTLVHVECQEDLMPSHPTVDGPRREIWGADEEESVVELSESDNWARYREDQDWVDGVWKLINRVANFDYIIEIERFVVNRDLGYAGQFDLLYQDQEHNETVLADFKTGKGVYDKNLIQLTAYAHAIPITVDRLEIIRMNPDRQDWEISSSHDWLEDRDDLWAQFCDLHEQLVEQRLDELRETIAEREDDALVEGLDDTEQLRLNDL